ncbi:hypothetical protein ACFE04_004842 [Oxalis oulophora]
MGIRGKSKGGTSHIVMEENEDEDDDDNIVEDDIDLGVDPSSRRYFSSKHPLHNYDLCANISVKHAQSRGYRMNHDHTRSQITDDYMSIVVSRELAKGITASRCDLLCICIAFVEQLPPKRKCECIWHHFVISGHGGYFLGA